MLSPVFFPSKTPLFAGFWKLGALTSAMGLNLAELGQPDLKEDTKHVNNKRR
jgi:hypothetical protein